MAHLKYTSQGSKQSTPASSLLPKCAPVTLKHLQALPSKLNLNDTFNTAVFAIATIAFWCQCHISKVCVYCTFDTTIQTTCPDHMVHLKNLAGLSQTFYSTHFGHLRQRPNCMANLLCGWIRAATVACSGPSPTTCKSTAMLPHQDTCLHSKWLMVASSQWGGHGLFLGAMNIWLSSDLSPLTHHSFCIGGTTHLLLMGVDPFIIMVQGHWKSVAFLEYWQSCEEIIPTFIDFSQSSKSSILSTMSAFKQCLIQSM